jgi:hypothetical protein
MRNILVKCVRVAAGVALGLSLISSAKASYDSGTQTYPGPLPITQVETFLTYGGLISSPGQFFAPEGAFNFSDPSWANWLVQPDHVIAVGNSVSYLTFKVKIQGAGDADISYGTTVDTWAYNGTTAVGGFEYIYAPGFGGWVGMPLDASGAPAATPVPEPTTMVAGVLLLLPFGASALRMLRKNRAA